MSDSLQTAEAIDVGRLTAGILCDALDAAGIDAAERCDGAAWSRAFSGQVVCGRVRTLRTGSRCDTVADTEAAQWFDSLQPGDLVWVHGDLRYAFWGELSSRIAMRRGVLGTVVEGLTRDVRRVAAIRYPVWSRGWSGVDIAGRGAVTGLDVPCRYAGSDVESGDTVFAGDDGVVLVKAAERERVEVSVGQILEREDAVIAAIQKGLTAEKIAHTWGPL